LSSGDNPRAGWSIVFARVFPVVFVALLLSATATAATAQVSLSTVVDLAQKRSDTVRLAQSDVRKAEAYLSETKDVFIPSLYFGSGLPAFPEVGYTGNLPTIWDAKVQSLVFSMQQFRYVQAARAALLAAQSSLKDTQEQVALDASNAYIELDTVNEKLDATRQQEQDAERMVEIEQKRTEAGVDPLNLLLQAQLTAAQMKLNRLHLETRAATLTKQLSQLTGLPEGSILTSHASIPEIPAVSGDERPQPTPALTASQLQAKSSYLTAKGDQEKTWTPELGFGILYNRNTQLLNNVNTFFPNHFLPTNNVSSGFSISLPIFDPFMHARARASAADALRAKVEAEQAQHQNDLQIATLSASLRELDTLAEIASLKQQIASENLKSTLAQLELGNGAGNGAGASAQLSPVAEQQARIDERQKFVDALDAGMQLDQARLNLLRALGHMQDWLNELRAGPANP
jgi:outer membrane protein TolC